jgi:hypothetical protein
VRAGVRRAGSVLAALAAAAAAQLTGLSPASADTGPMGRSTYVISMMDGRTGAIAVRLALYAFTADGRVTERYWGWRQDSISGKDNARWTKPASGYTTAGCPRACPIRTPVGFQKGAAARTASGRWSMESGTVLAIRWSGTSYTERWRLDDGTPGIVGARLLGGGTNTAGWGVGSNAAANRGVSIGSIYDTGWWITGPFAENAYSATTRHLSIGWSAADYTLCRTRTCMQGRRLTGADRRTWYHSYFAADPRVDGRKVYWNNQTGVVQHLEAPNSVCISASGGGHTNALLQALDDDGRFVGFVGVEASLNQRKSGQAVVAAYAMLHPAKLAAIGES